MNKHQPQPHTKPALLGSLTVALILGVVAACDRPGQQATNNAAQNLNPTQRPTINPADATWVSAKQTLTYEQFHFREIKETAIAATTTAIALTPTFTPSPPTPSPTMEPPEPTPTVQLGLFECSSTAGFAYLEYSCWRGVANGRFIYVLTGSERLGAGGDPGQGVILVFPPNPYQVYLTPGHIGAVQINSVNGSRFTLSAVDPSIHTAYIFNLTTRQFDTQSGTPIPTTPVPTVAP